ncbi:MAG: PD-(D/E)XK nuclease family protein [Myxococcota bacterium]
MRGDSSSGPRVFVGRGARATEGALLAEILQLADQVEDDPSRLAEPVFVVVPSRSLRDHVAERIVARRGRAVAGISVLSLASLAFEILRRAGEPTPGGRFGFAVLVRRHAAEEPALRGALGGLRDGYESVVASVEDLLDAGFEPAHASAADECLAAVGAGESVGRARALVRVARAACEALAEAGLEHRSALLRRAEEALTRAPGFLAARRVLVHGYADATGVQLELLATLVRSAGARVFLDHPGRPAADPVAAEAEAAFTDRLRERLEGLAPLERLDAAHEPALPQLLRAPGAQAEVRAAAERIQRLLAEGEVAERIGVVVRELGAYALPLRTQLRRLGIPFSGARGRLGPLTPQGRRLRALVGLIGAGPDAPTDLWLEALGALLSQRADATPGRARLADLRVGLHVLGAGRLRDVAAIDPKSILGEEDSLRLPVRRGLEARDERAEGRAPSFAPRRRLRHELLGEAVERARSLVERLEAWGGALDVVVHAGHLRGLVETDLGWDRRASLTGSFHDRVEAIFGEIPDSLRFGREELSRLLARAFEDLGRAPLGGEGGGVQVLDAMEARARTFDHLFVLGLDRGVFPRRVREDPLLPDGLRRRLLEVLPDVPIKARGHDEERYLFAQLCSASPTVTLSWQSQSDDGKERNASPFVERLQAGQGHPVPLAPSLLADPSGPSALPRPALERALQTGIHRRRSAFRMPYEVALEESAAQRPSTPLSVGVESLAAARCALLEEVDPSQERSRVLGPFFGFVGPCGNDPRAGDLYVTTLEGMARCPWRAFLEKVLRLEPVPDALEALPEVDALLLGSAVHDTLEALVRRATGDPPEARLTLEEVRVRTPFDIPWPAPRELDLLLRETASRVARNAGIVLPGFAELLASRARPFLEQVRVLDAPDGRLRGVLGAEVTGRTALPGSGGGRALYFRADRADLHHGRLRLTDYKTGRPKGAGPRALERELEGGLLLQGAAYARASSSPPAQGRYLHLRPDVVPDAAECSVDRDDPALDDRFERSATALVRAWTAGAFGPRLEDRRGNEPRQCDWCGVASACQRGDSTARRRLGGWLERGSEGDAPEGEAEQALAGVLALHGGVA